MIKGKQYVCSKDITYSPTSDLVYIKKGTILTQKTIDALGNGIFMANYGPKKQVVLYASELGDLVELTETAKLLYKK